MHFLFITERPPFGWSMGGIEVGTHQLARLALDQGHTVTWIALAAGKLTRLRLLLRQRSRLFRDLFLSDELHGYRTIRAGPAHGGRFGLAAAVGAVLDQERPDRIFLLHSCSPEMAEVLARYGAVVRFLFKDVLPGYCVPSLSLSADLIANSRFVADRVMADCGRPSRVVYPYVKLDSVVASDRRPECITLVNPIAEKGLHVVADLARAFPHERFLLVRGWRVPRERQRELRHAISTCRNVSVVGPFADMRAVYAVTKLGLVPSQVEEAFGRVVLEFQANGVPVIASKVGGVPEAAGDGGWFVPGYRDPREWADGLAVVLAELETTNARWSQRAIDNARRPEFSASMIGLALFG